MQPINKQCTNETNVGLAVETNAGQAEPLLGRQMEPMPGGLAGVFHLGIDHTKDYAYFLLRWSDECLWSDSLHSWPPSLHFVEWWVA